MRYFTLPGTRMRAVIALTAAAATAAVLGTAAPASASLSSDNWTAVALPTGYLMNSQTGAAPVSCVRHAQFCMVMTTDSADVNPLNHNLVADAVLVTTDGGQNWTGYNSLPTAFYKAISISCWSPSVCGVAGEDIHGEPQVTFTSDGGQTWTDPTPASWANASWIATSIDCISASTCWLTGLNGPFGNVVDPILLKTSNLGASWQNHSNLPGSHTSNPTKSYSLQDISCTSATSCVAVGGPNQPGTGSVLTTRNGGRTWTRFPAAGIDLFVSVSCAPGTLVAMPTCFATATKNGVDSVILTSRTGGRSWTVVQDFGAQDPFASITCTSASRCWAGGNGNQNEALDGTADGGQSWSLVTASQAPTDPGAVSCLSVSVCVATTDDGLWVTVDDGGLTG